MIKFFRNYNRFNVRAIYDNNEDSVLLYTDTWLKNFWYLVPDQFASKGLFWWRSQLSKWMFVPHDWVLDLFNNFKKEFEESNKVAITNVVGVHIRRGDKVFGSKLNDPEMGYVSLYKIVHTLYGR